MQGESYIILPLKTPARLRKSIICQTLLLMPKRAVAIALPTKEKTRTGFLPKRSAARPQGIIRTICVKENNDSYSSQTDSVPPRWDTHNQPAVKPNVRLFNISHLQDHLIDEWKDEIESNRLEQSRIAEEEYLGLW